MQTDQPDNPEALSRIVQLALAKGRPADAESALSQLHVLLPLHPIVQRWRQAAAMMSFPWPVRRNRVELSSCAHPHVSDLDLVVFHVDLASAVDYFEAIRIAFLSVRFKAPGARCVLITDPATQVPADLGADEVVRQDVRRDWLMHERMRLQADYLAAQPAGRFTVFMDADMVVNRDPSVLFAEDFDVALTWRADQWDAPFNGGLILVRNRVAGEAFLRATLDCYAALAGHAWPEGLFPADLRRWWGDQFALAIMAGFPDFTAPLPKATGCGDWRIRLFPCETHNFTLEPNIDHAPDVLAQKYFVHFKGARKPLQTAYFSALKSGQIG